MWSLCLRLIRHDRLGEINDRMNEFRDELDEAVEQLDRHFDTLKAAARERLGSLYNDADCPGGLRGLFAVSWDFPSCEPPDYLRQLNPEVYQQECQRVQERFSEAVRLAEQAFTEELAKLVSHLTERLSGTEDGRPKVFRDSVVGNLCVYGEEIDLSTLGQLAIRRASHVEPDKHGRWLADLSPVAGPVLGPFERRSDALDAERRWLEGQWLTQAH